MNRWLVRCNVALFACLFVLVVLNARAAFSRELRERGSSEVLAASSLRWVPLAAGSYTSGIIDFGTLMIPVERLEEAVPATFAVLEPAAKVSLRWHSPTQIELSAREPLRRATAYRIHFADSVRTLDGRRLPSDIQLGFETERVQLVSASCDEDEKGGVIHLRFDLAVASEEVQRRVSLTEGANLPIESRVEAIASSASARGDASEGTEYALRFAAGKADVTLRIAPELKAKIGDLALGTAVSRRFQLRAPLAATNASISQGRLRITFNHLIERPDPSLVVVEPAIPFQIEKHRDSLTLIGTWKPGSTQAVVLKAGFPGQGRFSLAADSRISVRLPDLAPSLGFTSQGSVVSALARPELTVSGVNVAKFEVSARTVYPNNLVRLLQLQRRSWYGGDETVFAPAKRTTVHITAARNETFFETIDLKHLLTDELGRAKLLGLHQVTLRALDGHATDTKLVQVTDLGLSVRATSDSVAVRVRSLAKGTAIEGAYVRILTATNQDLCSGVTSGDGTLLMTYARTAADREPFAIVASLGDDQACIDLDGFSVQLANDELGGRDFLGSELEACVSLARGAVRPGETVHSTISVRDALGRARAGQRFEARLHSPARSIVKSTRLVDDGNGLLTFEHTLPADAPTGAWRIDVLDDEGKQVLGTAPFRVDAFVPDRLEVSGEGNGAWALGQRVELKVHAAWLEGTPAAGLEAKVTARIEGVRAALQGYESWSFASLDPEPPPGALPGVAAVLDDRGTATLALNLPARSGCQRVEAHVDAEVIDPSGRPVRGSFVVPVQPKLGLIGIRALDDGATAIVLGGDPKAPPKVTLRLERRHWSWQVDTKPDGRGQYVCRVASDLIEEQTLDGGGTIRWKHAPTPGLWYVASARIGAPGEEQVAEQTHGVTPLRPDTLRLHASADSVRPGTDAEILVDAPFAGTAFLTLETTTVHTMTVRELPAGRSSVRITVPSELETPNLHVVATLTSGQAKVAAQGPFWICGATSLALAHEDRGTKVTLVAPAQVEPESRITLRIAAPGASRATVALVDEGVLRLTQHQSPQPLAHFLARRRLAGRGADGGTQLLQQVHFDKGVLIGGDDDAGGGGRLASGITDSIRTVALFSGPVRLDQNGEAECSFTLPPYEGRLRAMVIASGPRVVGSHAAAIAVAGPIGLRVAVPRRVSPGDTFAAVVSLRNSSGSQREIAVALEGAGSARLATGEPLERRLLVEDGKMLSFAVRVVAGDATGEQALVVKTRDVEPVRSARGAFAVRPLVPYEVERIGIACVGEQQVTIPSDFLESPLDVKLSVSGEPSARLLPILEALVTYPYGCAEQTTSRCDALLACRELLPQLAGDGPSLDAGALLDVGIARLMTMQTADGGLAMWPGESTSSPFVSVLALEMLHSAKTRGAAVPESALESLTRYANRVVAQSRDMGLRCFAVAAIAGRGMPVRGWLDRLGEEATTQEQRTLLALAHSRLSNREATLALLAADEPKPVATAVDAAASRSATTTLRVRNADGGAGEDDPGPEIPSSGMLYTSKERIDAWRLRALLAVAPADPRIPRLAESLTRAALDSNKLNTQTQNQVLQSLATFDRSRAGGRADPEATVAFGGRILKLRPNQRESLRLTRGETLIFRSKAPLYGLLTIGGFRVAPQNVASSGVSLRQELQLHDGKPALEPLSCGARATLVLTGETSGSVANLLLTACLPGGLEPDLEKPTLSLPRAGKEQTNVVARTEVQDDRVLVFAKREVSGKFRLRVPVRAVFAGSYATGPALAEALYDPSIRGVGPGGPRLVVETKVR